MIDLARLNICFLAGTLGSGGAERQLIYILRALLDAGAKLRLLTLARGEFWEATIRAMGVPVVWVGEPRARLGRLARIVRCLRSDPPDLIQSQHFYTNLYSAAAARILGAREVGAIRSDVFSELRSNSALLGRLSLRLPRLLAANSHRAIANAGRAGLRPGRVRYLPNVVDAQVFQQASPSSDEELTILFVGRLLRLKRLDLFLNTIAAVRAASSIPVRAVIAGDGPERKAVEQQARALGLSPEGVEFLGHLSAPSESYQRASILMLTSDWEGTPNVVLEAMSCGLPVVATSVGGVAEVVQDGATGFLVPPGDVGALTRRTLELIRNAEMRSRMGRSAREYILANHAPSILTHQLQEIYEAALA